MREKMRAKTKVKKPKFKTAKQIDPFLDSSSVNKSTVRAAMKYIKTNFAKRASFNREDSSYALKHIVEARIGRYVSNEDLIVAMVNCGFEAKPIVMGSKIYCFNVSRKSVKSASQGITFF